jgi:hypothetical protein
MTTETTNQVKRIPNPTGKGGFQEHPELRSNGRWSKENSFSYWMNYFKSLSILEFREYEKTKPEDQRTVAESLAYARVFKARSELKEFQEVANRTEGLPKQSIQHSVDENITQLEIKIIKNKNEIKDV